MPLNRLKMKNITYPNSPDVLPMISKLRFDKKLSPVFQQIFGKTVLCRDLDVASNIAHNSEFDSITLEGDQVKRQEEEQSGFRVWKRNSQLWMTRLETRRDR